MPTSASTARTSAPGPASCPCCSCSASTPKHSPPTPPHRRTAPPHGTGTPRKHQVTPDPASLVIHKMIFDWPVNPQGRGKQERLNRWIREAFLAEACHQGIESLDTLNDLFAAWAGQVANRRVHAETGQTPTGRFEAAGPPRQASPERLREAFRWPVTRRVTRTATVPLEGNAYAVDPALTGRRVELRYDPEGLTVIEVFLDGKPAGAATPFITRRHVHRAVPQAAR